MAETSKRPGIVTFVGIVLIVWGAFALLAFLSGTTTGTIVLANPRDVDPNKKADPTDFMASAHYLANEIPSYGIVTLVFAGLDLLFGVAMLMCGLGVLKLKPGYRVGTCWLVFCKLLYGIAFDVFTGMFIVPVAIRFATLQAALDVPKDMQNFVELTAIISVAGSMGCQIIIQLFMAILIISLLMGQTAKAAFSVVPLRDSPQRLSESPSQYSGYEEEA